MQLVDHSECETISAVLIVKNEAYYIGKALESVSWCDEIIVVDSESTDETASICKNPQAPWAKKIKFISQPWLGFSDQRNFAMEHAQSKWIFFLDGDESCSSELALKIKSILSKSALDASAKEYKIHRQEFFLGKKIRYGIWNPSYHVRLFRNGTVKFTGTVHEGTLSRNERETIHESIIHVEDLRIERILNKLNSYTSIQAKNDFDSGKRTCIARILLSFPAMLYKNYIYYKAYRDGKEGLIISILEGISRTVRHLKIWQLQYLEKSKNH
jgi:glycosyltransferase involved in cell wall biosynthesis